MKFIIPILILITVPCLAQDSLSIYSHAYLIENEIKCCHRAKNQLTCLDSLIQVNLNTIKHSGKTDPHRAYLDRLRKLGIYHFNAGLISGARGNLDQSFAYFDQMDRYLDTLNQNGKITEFLTIKEIARYQKTDFCIKAYRKDTAAFNRCNCMRFFPETKDKSVADTAASPEKQPLPIKYPNWGEFYIHNTLRINNNFVSDSTSIVYFKQLLQPLFLSKLAQNPAYFEILGGPAMNIISDTIIYKLSVHCEKGKYERNCELVFTSSQHPEWFDHFMVLMTNIEFPGFIRDLNIYIPIVVTSETSSINNVSVYDDHFRLDVKKIKPLDPK